MQMFVFDGILDGDDMAGVAPVDLLDKSGKRGALAGARRPTDQDQPPG
jgi:hypothetical protein